MSFTYKQTEPALWTVGSYDPKGRWEAESDHGSTEEAAARTRWLNGWGGEPAGRAETTEATADTALDEWCILELMGHRRLAGRVREVQLAGAGFLRLDIPQTAGHAAQTQFVAPGSVYALHPTTVDLATKAAARFRPEPVSRWELQQAQADPPGPDPGWDNDDDGHGLVDDELDEGEDLDE